MYSTSLYIF